MIPFRVILLFRRSLYSEMTRSTFLGGGGGGFDRDRLHEDVNLSTQPNSSSTKSFCVHFVSQRRFGS